ncbi:hypothetical protein, partial [Paraburkholderia caffeinilytica]|uniref:hypothetical protein n=1 Tax=Paraburkholderia caffeinilytica TaxID=1761016 RepID=UPI001C2E3A7B
LNSASNPVKPNATVRWAADVQRNSDIMFAALGDRSWPNPVRWRVFLNRQADHWRNSSTAM